MDDIEISIKSRTTGATRDISLSELVDMIDSHRHNDTCIHVLPIITSRTVTLSFRLYRHGTANFIIEAPLLPTYVQVPKGVSFRINGEASIISNGSEHIVPACKDRGSSILIRSTFNNEGLHISIV